MVRASKSSDRMGNLRLRHRGPKHELGSRRNLCNKQLGRKCQPWNPFCPVYRDLLLRISEWRGGKEVGKERWNVPVIWHTNSVIPIPMGARNVALCFSTANIKMTTKNWIVRNISMKSPWTIEVPAPKETLTSKGPGKRAETTPAAAMPARIWHGKTRRPRIGGTAPMRTRPRVTWKVSTLQKYNKLWMSESLNRLRNEERETYSRVQHAPVNPIESPHIHSNWNTKRSCNKQQRWCI